MLKRGVPLQIVLLAALLGSGCVDAQGNATTTPPPPELFAFSDTEEAGFPAWLVGVIVLSVLVVVIAIATIVQRVLRRRNNQRERYRMAS